MRKRFCSPSPERCVRNLLALSLALVAIPGIASAQVTSSITSNFNGTAVPAGDYIWFNSVINPPSLPNTPVTIDETNASLMFSIAGKSYDVALPNSQITYSPTATQASTVFNTATNTWVTVIPDSQAGTGNQFLNGVAFKVPTGGLPGGSGNVTWTGQFSTTAPAGTFQWQWGAAAYNGFSSDPNALGVKASDASGGSDHAGTPENFTSNVVGGARGGGGSNFTGSYSGTASFTPTALVPENDSLILVLYGLGAAALWFAFSRRGALFARRTAL